MFCERLKQLRLNEGLNQQEMADQLGINRSTYAGYESGAREPDFATLKIIAARFKSTSDYLLGIDIQPPYILTTLSKDEALFIQGALDLYRKSKALSE